MQQFNLDTATKRTPYRVPENFFETLEQNIIAQTVGKTGMEKVTPAVNRWRPKLLRSILTSAAAVAVAVAIGIGIYATSPSDTLTPDQAFANLSLNDQEFLIDCYDNDMMLEAYLN